MLKTVLRHTILLLELFYALGCDTRVLIHTLTVLPHLLLLLFNELLLTLL